MISECSIEAQHLWHEMVRTGTPPPKMTCSEWAEQFRILPQSWARYAGRWDNNRMPWLRRLMDAYSDPVVRKIIGMKSAQAGFSEAAVNMLGYSISCDPGTALWVCSTDDEKYRVKHRLQALAECTQAVQSEKKGGRYVESMIGFQYKSMAIWLASAGSPSEVGMLSCRTVMMDEVNKWPQQSGREAAPSSLAAQRVHMWRDISKIIMFSTPTDEDGVITMEYELSHKLAFFVPCPHCGVFQQIVFEQFKWKRGEPNTGRYECVACGKLWRDEERSEVVVDGVWNGAGESPSKSMAEGDLHKPELGFHVSRFYSRNPEDTIPHFVREWEKCEKYPVRAMDYYNSTRGEPYAEKDAAPIVGSLSEKYRDGYVMGQVPRDVQVVTATADVHPDFFRYTVRGWGSQGRSWLILLGNLPYVGRPDFKALDRIINRTWVSMDGRDVPMQAILIDSGYRTTDVYDYAATDPAIIHPTKGSETIQIPFRMSTLKESGMQIWIFKPSFFKDELYGKFALEPSGPNAWLHPADTPDWYFREITAEKKIRRVHQRSGRVTYDWQIKRGAENHAMDCEVLQLLASSAFDLRNLPSIGSPVVEAVVTASRDTSPDPDQPPSEDWLGDTGNWLKGW